MIGLDTNIVLRLILQDDAEHYSRADAALRSMTPDESVFVGPVVVQEAVRAMLKVRAMSKTAVLQLLRDLLEQDDLVIGGRAALERALDSWDGGPADFADYFIAELNVEAGCRSTLTFDAKAAKHPAFSPVP